MSPSYLLFSNSWAFPTPILSTPITAILADIWNLPFRVILFTWKGPLTGTSVIRLLFKTIIILRINDRLRVPFYPRVMPILSLLIFYHPFLNYLTLNPWPLSFFSSIKWGLLILMGPDPLTKNQCFRVFVGLISTFVD